MGREYLSAFSKKSGDLLVERESFGVELSRRPSCPQMTHERARRAPFPGATQCRKRESRHLFRRDERREDKGNAPFESAPVPPMDEDCARPTTGRNSPPAR